MFAYVNGSIKPFNEASVSIDDLALQRGQGLFETMHVFEGRVIALEKHLQRLERSLAELRFPEVSGFSDIVVYCNDVIEANDCKSGRLKVIITAGGDSLNPGIIITVTEFEGYSARVYREGATALLLEGFRHSRDALCRHKTTSRLNLSIARQMALDKGYDEAVLVNEHGAVCEGSHTNLFAVRDNRVLTPPVADGLLPGVTRDIGIGIARDLSYETLERSIPADDLYGMDEVFLTGSLIEVAPLTQLDGKRIATGTPGPLTQKIHDEYRRLAASGAL